MSRRLRFTYCGYNLYSFSLRLDLQYRWNLKSVNRSHTVPPVKCFHPVWIHFEIMLSPDMSADLIMPETKASKVTAFVNSTCAHVRVFFYPEDEHWWKFLMCTRAQQMALCLSLRLLALLPTWTQSRDTVLESILTFIQPSLTDSPEKLWNDIHTHQRALLLIWRHFQLKL